MFKKKLNNRLETLFANLDQTDQSANPTADVGPKGWTWECDSHGCYTTCSQETAGLLGISPDEFRGQPLADFALDPQSREPLKAALDSQQLPRDLKVNFKAHNGSLIPVQITLLRRLSDNGRPGGLTGFCELLSKSPAQLVPARLPVTQSADFITPLSGYPGVSIDANGVHTASALWTHAGKRSLETRELIAHAAQDDVPCTIAAPIVLKDTALGVMEIVAEDNQRKWKEDERQLVLEVSTQLALALENAQLYASAQQELAERMRAEQEARRRSEEMAVVNRVVTSVSASLDLRAGLQVVIDELAQVFSITSGAIALLDQDKSAFTIVVEYTRQPGNSYVGSKIPLENNPSSKVVIETRKPLVINEVLTSPLVEPIRDLLQARGMQSMVLLPLIVANEVIGTVGMDFDQSGKVPAEEGLHLAETIIFQAAAAIQNARLFEQTQKALAETELLYEITRTLAESRSPQDLVELVVAQALPHNAERVSLMYLHYSPENEPLDMEVVGFWDRRGQEQAIGLKIPSSAIPYVFQMENAPLIVEQIAASSDIDPVTLGTLASWDIGGMCIVPLLTSGRLLGILGIFSSEAARFSAGEIRLLKVVGDGIAIALQRHQLMEEAQRRALELQTAAEIARDTSGTLALDALLARAVNMVRDRFGFYHASIFLIDESGAYAVVRESTGAAGEEMKRRQHHLAVGSKSVVGTATGSMQPFLLNDVTQSPNYHANPLLPDTRAELCIPLKISQRVIGALDVQSDQLNAFRREDMAALEVLADQIAVAIENARAYEISQKAIQEMREVDRVKSQFLANMSHELRTPLNSIIGFSRVILKGIDGPVTNTQEQDLTAIYNSGQHLLSLINDILDLSKIEAGKMELAFSEVNLTDLITSVMSTATGLVKDKSIKLIKQIPQDLPVVQADPMRVRQVLLNLISNAAKFTEQGSIIVAASVQAAPDGAQEMIVTVKDSGPGISPEDQSKLFLPFSQVDDSPTRKTGGTGLGLSICRSLIEMHYGRIGLLQSEIGKGSTFYFTLPMQKPEIPTEVPATQGNVVLAIDDDRQVIGLYERYLSPQGYRVIPLTKPALAVEKARELQPFAITLDIMMPDIDGWQVMHALKNDPQTSHIPVIICSILEEEEKGFSLGAADYLVKPILQEDLINALNRLNRDGSIHEVLVIDDDPADLRLVQKILEETSQYQVTVAQGGTQGWAYIRSKAPDAIILDLFMPDMNGFAILENLRSTPSLCNIPVIVLSGADLTSEQHQQLETFGQSMLTKGALHPHDLLSVLENALKKLQPVQER